MVSLTSYEKSLHVRLRNINSRTVLINSKNMKCFEIDEIGKIIWKGIGKSISPVEQLEKNGIELPENLDVVAQDIKDFLDFLIAEELINEV